MVVLVRTAHRKASRQRDKQNSPGPESRSHEPRFVKTARRYRTIQIQAGRHTIAAADPFPSDLRQAIDGIHSQSAVHYLASSGKKPDGRAGRDNRASRQRI
jgi:hypothetical protein